MIRLNTLNVIVLTVVLAATAPLAAWGPEGHRIVGVDALALTDEKAREAVREILGDLRPDTLDHACSWPDDVRETPEWEWSAPLHYVNMPRSAEFYDRQRDCRDGECVTEAIREYANRLTQAHDDPQRRWRDFAWLCHLVGDLHQPLHAGLAEDRGGNNLEVTYQGENWNLHQFWDRALVRDRLGEGDAWARPILLAPPPRNWRANRVDDWTSESHAIALHFAYPPEPDIGAAFADQGWQIVRQQWQKAAHRLAQILSATLGEGEVLPED
jgi:hypothetical protein